MITRELEVLLRTDIVELLLSDEVELRRDGEHYVGRTCPFHGDICTVNADRWTGLVTCSQGLRLNAADYLMRRYNWTRKQAVNRLWELLEAENA